MQAIKYNEDKKPFVDLGNGFKIRFEDEQVTDEIYLEKAKNELREEPVLQREAIDELKELVKSKFRKNFD